MESSQIEASKKRSLTMVQAQELMWKIKSKADFLDYLDKHRKYPLLTLLTSI